MSAIVYGIKNCDTMKKALKWLEENEIDFSFHDYKKDGVAVDVLKQAFAAHGWQEVLNRKGTSWRQLPAAVREEMDDGIALQTALQNPSVIKRPLLLHEGRTWLGFSAAAYHDIFS